MRCVVEQTRSLRFSPKWKISLHIKTLNLRLSADEPQMNDEETTNELTFARYMVIIDITLQLTYEICCSQELKRTFNTLRRSENTHFGIGCGTNVVHCNTSNHSARNDMSKKAFMQYASDTTESNRPS